MAELPQKISPERRNANKQALEICDGHPARQAPRSGAIGGMLETLGCMKKEVVGGFNYRHPDVDAELFIQTLGVVRGDKLQEIQGFLGKLKDKGIIPTVEKGTSGGISH